MASSDAEHGGDPGVERAGVAVGAEEGHELDDHDQRAGGGLGQRQAAHHLARRQPAVDLDRLLGHVGEHGVGAAEGDQRGPGEEQPLRGEDAAGAGQQRRRRATGTPQTSSPTTRIRTVAAPRLGRSACRASSGISGGGPLVVGLASPWPARVPGASRPSSQPATAAAATTTGNGTANRARARNEATAMRHQGRVAQGAAADPEHGLGDDRQHRGGEPGEERGDGGGVAAGDVDRRQGEQGDHAGQHEQDAGDQPAAEPVQQPADVDRPAAGPRGRAAACSSSGRAGTGAGRSSAAPRPGSRCMTAIWPAGPAEGLQRDGEPGPHRLRRTGPHRPSGRRSGWRSVTALGWGHAGSRPSSRARRWYSYRPSNSGPARSRTCWSSCATIDSPRRTTSRPGASGAS